MNPVSVMSLLAGLAVAAAGAVDIGGTYEKISCTCSSNPAGAQNCNLVWNPTEINVAISGNTTVSITPTDSGFLKLTGTLDSSGIHVNSSLSPSFSCSGNVTGSPATLSMVCKFSQGCDRASSTYICNAGACSSAFGLRAGVWTPLLLGLILLLFR